MKTTSLLNLFHKLIVFGKNEFKNCAVWPLRLLSCLEWVYRVSYREERAVRGTSTGALGSASLCIKHSLSAFLLCSSFGICRVSSISSYVLFQLFRHTLQANFWTSSSILQSLTRYGSHTWFAYSRCGLMSVK